MALSLLLGLSTATAADFGRGSPDRDDVTSDDGVNDEEDDEEEADDDVKGESAAVVALLAPSAAGIKIGMVVVRFFFSPGVIPPPPSPSPDPPTLNPFPRAEKSNHAATCHRRCNIRTAKKRIVPFTWTVSPN
jgi:hypothetical protein